MKRKKYGGELSKPSRPELKTLPVSARVLMAPQDQARHEADNRDGNFAALAKHELHGLGLLLDHYQIHRDETGAHFALLALALARDHVPYYQPKQAKRGIKGREQRAALLEIDVALRRVAGDVSDARALEHLRHHISPWKGMNVDSLERNRRRDAGLPIVEAVIKGIASAASGPKVLAMLRTYLAQCNSSSP